MRTRWMLIIAFLIVFIAGGTVGGLVGVNQQPEPEKRADRPSRFIADLDLTEAQKDQMKQIWTDAMKQQMQSLEETRRELRKERDDAIHALMTEQQLAAIAEIEADYERGSDKVREARREVFEEAHEKTRAILTPEQRERFDAEIERRREEWGNRGPGRGGRGGRGGWGRHGDGDGPHHQPPPPGDNETGSRPGDETIDRIDPI